MTLILPQHTIDFSFMVREIRDAVGFFQHLKKAYRFFWRSNNSA